MNATQVRDAMTTFLGAQLARWEGREMDADLLESGYEGKTNDLTIGAYLLNAYLIVALSEERDETPVDTARTILTNINIAEIIEEDCEE
jgi:hypothetical protein